MDLIRVEKITQYWRNSVADAARMDIDRKKLELAFSLPREEVVQGKISEENTKLLFSKAKREKSSLKISN